MIDASIPLQYRPIQVPDQMSSLAGVMQLVNAQQGVKLGQLQLLKAQRDMADEEATKTAYAAYLRDPSGVSLAQLGEKNPKLVQDILKQQREAAKDEATIKKDLAEADMKRFEVGAKKAERAANILSSAKDQASYELALSSLVQNFGEGAIAGLPERYDPALLGAKVQEGMTLKDRLERQFQDRKLAWEQQSKAVDQATARYSAESGRISANASVTSAGAAASNARTNAGRLELERTAPKGVYDPTRGVVVDPRNSTATPVTQNGQPIGAQANKPTEAYLKQQTGVENVRNAITEYRKALKDTPAWKLAQPSEAAKLGTLYNNMMLQAKEAYNLGVLNGHDYSILQKVVTDPLSLRGLASFNSTMDAQAETLDRLMEGIGKTSARVHGQPEPAPDPAKFGLKPASR